MVVGLLWTSLSIPESRSLKDKRSVIRSLRDRVMLHMNVSVAEVGRQDAWQFAEMAFVTVAAEKVTVEKRISEVSEVVRSDPRAVLLDLRTEYL